jgi:uncharacterized protein
MLYQIGPLSVKVAPFNVDTVDRESASDYVTKPIVGAEPPLEFVGEGSNSLRMSGTLFPKVIDGLSELSILQLMRSSGRPQFILRGDGTPFGWYAITRVTERSSSLYRDGIGQQVRVDIEMTRANSPPALALFAMVAGLFS